MLKKNLKKMMLRKNKRVKDKKKAAIIQLLCGQFTIHKKLIA